MRTIELAISAMFLCLGAYGQTAAPKLEFEVASVKPAVSLAANMQVNVGLHVDGAMMRVNYFSVRDLICMAYHVRAHQVEGPEWISSERFDLAAKLPDGAKREQVPAMLQALLADRFQVVLHRGSKDLPVLALTVAKGGPKLKESPEGVDAGAAKGNVDVAASGGPSGVTVSVGQGSSYFFGNNRFEAKRMTMASLADSLARYSTEPLVDMTGLTKAYDFVLDLTPEDYRAMLIRSAIGAGVQLPQEALRMVDGNTADSLTAALEGLGLKLERKKAPVEMLIVDKGTKTPSAN